MRRATVVHGGRYVIRPCHPTAVRRTEGSTVEPFLRLPAEDLGEAGSGPPGGALGALAGATGWLNSGPLTAAQLRGRVVLVSFWTYTCINWLRTLPYLRAWAARYTGQGLVVIGVHTPELDFERDVGNVRRAAERLRITYPIAVDTEHAVWNGFGNRYWPALYLVDAEGRLRHQQFGEGDDERSEHVLRQLLTEAGARGIGREPTPVDARGVEAAADWRALHSHGNHLGYERTENLVSVDGVARDVRHVYGVPARLRRDHWALSGDWTVRHQATVLNHPGGGIAYRFHARDLHLVMAPVAREGPVRFRVALDGQPLGAAHGTDTDGRGAGTVIEPRLYQLVRQPGPVPERTFQITFLDAGVRAYAVTFG